MVVYKHRNIENYLKHMKELKKKGIEFLFSHGESEYRGLFYNYDDFVLYIDEEDKSLRYGSERRALSDGYEVIMYINKRTNTDSY